MIEVEVTSCTTCLFRGYLNRGPVCFATRLGKTAGGILPYPTKLPEEMVPSAVEHGESLPHPPDWCPLYFSYLVIGIKGKIPAHVTQVPNLWSVDIGVLNWMEAVEYSQGDRVSSFGLVYICICDHTSSADTRPGLGNEDEYSETGSWKRYWLYLEGQEHLEAEDA